VLEELELLAGGVVCARASPATNSSVIVISENVRMASPVKRGQPDVRGSEAALAGRF
jgi:hypothetical protein